MTTSPCPTATPCASLKPSTVSRTTPTSPAARPGCAGTCAERWRAAIAEHPRQAELLRSLLKDGRVTLAALTGQAAGAAAHAGAGVVGQPLPPDGGPAGASSGSTPSSSSTPRRRRCRRSCRPSPAPGRSSPSATTGSPARGRSPSGVERLAAGESSHQGVESAYKALAAVLARLEPADRLPRR